MSTEHFRYVSTLTTASDSGNLDLNSSLMSGFFNPAVTFTMIFFFIMSQTLILKIVPDVTSYLAATSLDLKSISDN